MNLTGLSITELMLLNQKTLDELEEREIIRTRNNPVSDYTEWLVASRMNMELASPSTKGYDALDSNGRRVQIKSRKNNLKNRSTTLGIIRNYELNQFDDLIAIIYHPDFSIRLALCIPHELVKQYGFFNAHQNGYTLNINAALTSDPKVVDIYDLICGQPRTSQPAEKLKQSDIVRDLQTVGMSTFLEYYQYILTESSAANIIEKMIKDHPDWKEGTARTKTSTIKRIIKNGEVEEALSLISKSNHPNITNEMKSRAIELILSYRK